MWSWRAAATRGCWGKLSRQAAAHPLDERLVAQLMLALYLNGRQADALHHYEQMRQRLAEELGADPCAPVQALHLRILSADPSLDAPTPEATETPLPRQLPAPPPSFAGRVRELAALSADRLTVVSGTAGVGKSALALHWAHQVADEFADGLLYVNLRGFDPGGSVMSAAEAIRGFLDALAVPSQRIPTGLDAQAALYRSLLAGRRMLHVLVLADGAAARREGRRAGVPPGTAARTGRDLRQASGVSGTYHRTGEVAMITTRRLASRTASVDRRARHVNRPRSGGPCGQQAFALQTIDLAGNNTAVSKLAPSCHATPLWGDAEPGAPVEVILSCSSYHRPAHIGRSFTYSNPNGPSPVYDYTSARKTAMNNTSYNVAVAVKPVLQAS